MHIALAFSQGGTAIVCKSCDRVWRASISGKIVRPDVWRADYGLGANDIRELPPAAGPILPLSPAIKAIIEQDRETVEAMNALQRALKQFKADIQAPQPQIRVRTEEQKWDIWSWVICAGVVALFVWHTWVEARK